MPHDIFGDVSRRRPSARSRRSSLVAVSIATHVAAIVGWLALTLLAPIPLPSPRTALAYFQPALVRMDDIPLPPVASPVRATSSPTSASTPAIEVASGEVAPVALPAGIGAETGREGLITTASVPVTTGLGAEFLGPGAFGTREALGPPPPPPPVQPVLLHSGINAPVRTTYVEPVYPTIARTARVSGTVILEAVIDVNGRVESLRVLRSVTLLDEAAMTAVRRWQFTPARLNGEAVPVIMTVTVIFTLN